MLQIAGGWGYNNLGDEAILAGYLENLAPSGHHVVHSVDPRRTSFAQRLSVPVVQEGRRSPASQSGSTLIAGGGFLNGNWRREIRPKLTRLARVRDRRPLAVHGVEVRNLAHSRTHDLAHGLLRNASIAVRDEDSAAEIVRLGLPAPEVLPDGISLLYPHLKAYSAAIPELEGRIILNLLDVGGRNDAHEAEIDLARWREYCEGLIGALDGRAVGMVIGGGDYRFLRTLPPMDIIEPSSVNDLISIIDSSAGVVSVRMHPALLSTAMGKPTVSIPYCGKVRPTLERIGVGEVIQVGSAIQETLDRLDSPSDDFSTRWLSAYALNSAWLKQNVHLDGY